MSNTKGFMILIVPFDYEANPKTTPIEAVTQSTNMMGTTRVITGYDLEAHEVAVKGFLISGMDWLKSKLDEPEAMSKLFGNEKELAQ